MAGTPSVLVLLSVDEKAALPAPPNVVSAPRGADLAHRRLVTVNAEKVTEEMSFRRNGKTGERQSQEDGKQQAITDGK
jgi:hypothetical protein